MINKIDDGCAFKANLKSYVEISNKKRFHNIQELFKKATKNYPKETLYLSYGSESGKISLHTANFEQLKHAEDINTASLEEYMKKFSDKEIVAKLAGAFKVLRLTDIATNLRNTIKYNREKFISNKNIASTLRKAGRDNFAEKYEIFAKFNKEKIANLKTQLENVENSFNKQKAMATKQMPELREIEVK